MPLVSEELMNVINDTEYSRKRKALMEQIKKTTAFATADPSQMNNYLIPNFREDGGNFNRKPKQYRAIVRRVLQEYLNGVTGLPITRTSNIEVDLDSVTTNLDVRLIQTRMEIEGTIAVRPIWEDGEVFYQIVSASDLIPWIDDRTGKLLALAINCESAKNKIVEIWTDESIDIIIDGKQQNTIENPYSTIPFVIYRASIHPTSFWGISDLHTIVENNNTINKMLTDLQQLATDQSFGIYVYMGPLPGEEDRVSGEPSVRNEPLKIGTGRMIALPEGGKMEILSPNALIKELNETIDNLTRGTFEDAMVFTLEKNSEYSTGFSISVKKGPYLRYMASKRIMFAKKDQRLVELSVLAKDVAERGPSTINPDFKVKTVIDATSLTPESAQEETLKSQFLMGAGVINKVDLLVEDKGMSREEAIEFLRQKEEENVLLLKQEKHKLGPVDQKENANG